MKAKPLYIFDLDGTLADIKHRRHFVECDRKFQRWDEFHKACVNDSPNVPVIETMNHLLESGADVWIFSGRSNMVELETRLWLNENIKSWSKLQGSEKILVMRKHGDFTRDDLLKKHWYEIMFQYDKDRLVAVFDDRKRVVDMWRSLGVTCFQVAEGDF